MDTHALKRNVGMYLISVLVSLLLVSGVVFGATTINDNISTGGTLSVTGASTLTGAVTMEGALSVTGLATFLGGATTTTLTFLNGEVISNGTNGVIQIAAIASTTSLTLLNGETITNATDGTITLGATNVVLVGTASTSAIAVGDEPNVPTINGLAFGYCTFPATTIQASSTAYVNCTTSTAGILTTSDRVFVQATSSLPAKFVVQSASSTGVSTINLRIINHGDDVGTVTTGINSVNFWAVR